MYKEIKTVTGTIHQISSFEDKVNSMLKEGLQLIQVNMVTNDPNHCLLAVMGVLKSSCDVSYDV